MQHISPQTLRQWQQEGKEFQLVDVREQHEHDTGNIGGLLLPLGELMRRKDEIPAHIPVVIYCAKGVRSIIAIQRLEGAGANNLYNLEGGLRAWVAAADKL